MVYKMINYFELMFYKQINIKMFNILTALFGSKYFMMFNYNNEAHHVVV